MVDSPQVALKVVVIVHFILSVWASMFQQTFLNVSYVYMNAFILAIGMWAIISHDSVDAILMFFILMLISIPMDIIFLGIFATHADNYINVPILQPYINDYRFSLGMSILNLIIKPLTSLILFRLYQDRLGVHQFPQFGIRGGLLPGYQPISTNGNAASQTGVETATPYSSIDKRPLPYDGASP